MTTDITSKISENPKKKKQIQHLDEGKPSKKGSDRQRGHSLDLYEVWSRNYRLSPLGAAKGQETEIFEITTLKLVVIKGLHYEWQMSDRWEQRLAWASFGPPQLHQVRSKVESGIAKTFERRYGDYAHILYSLWLHYYLLRSSWKVAIIGDNRY